MAAANPQGAEQFWFEGLPWDAVANNEDLTAEQFWFEGLPITFLIPQTVVASTFPAMFLAG